MLTNADTLMGSTMSIYPETLLASWSDADILAKKSIVESQIAFLRRNVRNVSGYGTDLSWEYNLPGDFMEINRVRNLAHEFDANPDAEPAWRLLWLSLHEMVRVLDNMQHTAAQIRTWPNLDSALVAGQKSYFQRMVGCLTALEHLTSTHLIRAQNLM